jgi:hypothetical protein
MTAANDENQGAAHHELIKGDAQAALADQFGMPIYLDLTNHRLSKERYKQVPYAFVTKHVILPIHDIDLVIRHFADSAIEGRRLTASRRTSDQDNAFGKADELLKFFKYGRKHADLIQTKQNVALVKNTENNTLPASYRDGTHPEINFTASHAQFDPAVLRKAMFGNIEL